MVGGVFEMSVTEQSDLWIYYQELLKAQGFEGITDLLAKYHNLERVNKEWEALWKPIDELVRSSTPLGESVGDKAVDWIKQGMFYDSFKERDKAYAEWMGRQETSLKAQITLQGVAKVAHAGGLYGYGDMGDALTRIREMTIPYWDKVTHNE